MSNKTHDMEHSADFYHGLLVRAEAELAACKAKLARVEALLLSRCFVQLGIPPAVLRAALADNGDKP